MIEILKKGANTESVKFLKKRLNLLTGSKLDESNSSFGDNTEAVVKSFQKSRNLLDDGVVGESTWKKLTETIIPINITAKDIANRAVQIAKTQLHVKEATGRNDGEAVESYLRSVGLGKGFPWCAAFVYWCFNQAAKDLNIPNPLAKTAGVLDHWNKAKNNRVTSPKVGDVMIMDFGGGKGHTGIVISVNGSNIETIEGNTANDPKTPNADREGQGVFIRNRKISSIKGFIRY